MLNLYHLYQDPTSLQEFLTDLKAHALTKQTSSVLVQIFTSSSDQDRLETIITTVGTLLPSSVIVGATTVGEIAEGQALTGTIVLSFSLFEGSQVTPFALSCAKNEEFATGQKLQKMLKETAAEIAGVLFLTCLQKINGAAFLKGFYFEKSSSYLAFGGEAGNYASPSKQDNTSFVFLGTNFIPQGVIAIAFSGPELHLCAHTNLGWQPLSKEMTVTQSDGIWAKSIDHQKAFALYKRYLDVPQNEDLFMNVLEFPLLLERNGKLLARVPKEIDEQEALKFTDLYAGEKIRIGYGHPRSILENNKNTLEKMCAFAPEAIFLYSCCCRRFLLQNEINLETEPFELIAPTSGFFTYGEICAKNNYPNLLNCSLVVVGLREGEVKQRNHADDVFHIIFGRARRLKQNHRDLIADPYVSSHMQITARLMHFMQAITAELEETNQKLKVLSEVDRLTQVYNRLKLDSILDLELYQARRYNSEFSIILLDMDHFKRINDTYGHNVGDKVLWRAAQVLKTHIRRTDTIGRWGGEEFLVVLPFTNAAQAYRVAEKLRLVIANTVFPIEDNLTCSFGITSYLLGEDVKDLIKRADDALYLAKRNGRNQIVQI